jgi:hypothetical protein
MADVLTVDCSTGEAAERPMTAEELAQRDADAAAAAAAAAIPAPPTIEQQIATLKAQNVALINTTGALLDIVMGM